MLLPKTSVTSGGMIQSYEPRMKKQPPKYKILLMLFALAVTRALLSVSAFAIEPPPMPQRAIAPDNGLPPGKRMPMNAGNLKFTLFIPAAWQASESALTVHFHTAEWFVIQEHVRRGARHPLAAFYLGEGSMVYRRPFENPKGFGEVLRAIEKELGAPIKALELSSFSAGYGAVREIIKQPEYAERIGTIVLADSMYAALETNSVRRPLREHIEVWLPFASAAIEGRKTFVFTYSAVPTTSYASSSECAHALLAALDLPVKEVAPGSTPAAADKDFPLLRRADAGNLHVWGYGGTNAQAHMTHPRHVADIWKALGK